MQMLDLSQIWPEWQVIGPPLGVGSFGAVYKAVRRDNLVESYAAIKVISIPKNPTDVQSLQTDGVDLQDLVNGCVSEIQLMESLKGIQNIVSVEDYRVIPKTDSVGWDIYIRMELLTPLTAYVAQHPLSQQEVIKLGCDICTALEVCSKKGIIHRDIKPENIFVNEFGDFKLGDFGIARKLAQQQSANSIKGSPPYMAPEVANSKDYDGRVDIYSLGIVLYRYLNRNKLPFLNLRSSTVSAKESEEATTRRLRGDKLPPPVDASNTMADVILRACAYNPNARFQDAFQMKQALLTVLDGPAPRKKRKAGGIIALLSVLVLLLGGGVALYFTGILPQLLANLPIPGVSDRDPESTQQTTDPQALEKEQIRAALAQAEALAQKQDLEGAIVLIGTHLSDHPDSRELQDALNTYTQALEDLQIADVLAQAQAQADEGNYNDAMVVLEQAMTQQGRLQAYLDAYAGYQSAYNAAFRDDALANIRQLTDNQDYLAAVNALDQLASAVGMDQELTALRSQLEERYVPMVISRADDLLGLEAYSDAENMMDRAAKLFPNNQVLQEAAHRVRNARPVYLVDVVAPYKAADRYSKFDTLTKNGNRYTKGFTCMGYGDYNKGNQVFFNLDGKYSLLEFTSGIIYDQKLTVTILFHADGELVGKVSMKSGDQPSNHTINIVGCRQLMISVYDGCPTPERSGTYVLSDITLTRNLSVAEDSTPVLKENQVYLLDEMKPYKTPAHYTDSSTLSMGGQRFNHGFSCMGFGNYAGGNRVYFNLDGNYSKLTFTAGIVLDRGLKVTYKFYTDGQLACELTLGESDLAVTQSFNVEGCKQLIIDVYDWKQTPDVSGTYGIAEIILDKSSNYSQDKDPEPLGAGQHYLLDVVKPHTTPTRYDASSAWNMGGKRYNNGFSCMGYGDYNKGNQTHFTLDGKYKQLSFTAGTILDRDLKVTYLIMADGKVIYQFTMDAGALPTDHTVSIEGCKELVICVYDRQRGADTSGTYGIGNIIVTE